MVQIMAEMRNKREIDRGARAAKDPSNLRVGGEPVE
jgi:hypothetical protein